MPSGHPYRGCHPKNGDGQGAAAPGRRIRRRRQSHRVGPGPVKFAIVGAGAIGAYLGAKLSLAGEDVHLVARGPHLKAMQAPWRNRTEPRRGLRGPSQRHRRLRVHRPRGLCRSHGQGPQPHRYRAPTGPATGSGHGGGVGPETGSPGGTSSLTAAHGTGPS